MATDIEVGVNCGFVLNTSPTDLYTPASNDVCDGRSYAMKLTVPADATTVTEFGLYSNSGTGVSDVYFSFYLDDSDGTQPGSRWGSLHTAATGLTATAAEYIKVSVSIDVTSKQGQTLWLAFGANSHTGSSYAPYHDFAEMTTAYKTGTTGLLPDPWGTKTGARGEMAFYALYTTGGGAVASKIPQMMANYRRRRS